MPFKKGHTINKGRKWSQETKESISKTLMGHSVSLETRRKDRKSVV